MKFDMHKYWKHINCIDVFFAISGVAFDEDGKNAFLHGTWCTQGTAGRYFTISDRLKITPEQYENWKPYTPMGKLRL